MTDAWGSLHIEVRDEEIIVTLPLTSYTVTYCKPANSLQLLAKRIADKDDPRVLVTLSEFLARAWKAANDRARELGIRPATSFSLSKYWSWHPTCRQPYGNRLRSLRWLPLRRKPGL
jgi:hypothetical protein